MDKNALNTLLFHLDILEAGCGLSDDWEPVKEHEYRPEATKIATLLAEGASVHTAVAQAFAARFQSAGLTRRQCDAHLARVVEDIESHQRLALRRSAKPQRQGAHIDAEALSLLLWQADLMHTSCNVNEGMEDEYSRQAQEITELMRSGVAFRPALMQVFDDWFDEGCLHHEGCQAAIASLEQAVAELQGPQ